MKIPIYNLKGVVGGLPILLRWLDARPMGSETKAISGVRGVSNLRSSETTLVSSRCFKTNPRRAV